MAAGCSQQEGRAAAGLAAGLVAGNLLGDLGARREQRARLVRRSIQESGGSLGAFVVCAGIWAASGASGAFWPIWVLIPFVLFTVRSGWDLFGPDGDLHAGETRRDARARERAVKRERHRRR